MRIAAKTWQAPFAPIVMTPKGGGEGEPLMAFVCVFEFIYFFVLFFGKMICC